MTAGVPYQFAAGQVAASAQVNANFAALVSYLNGLTIPTTPVTIANGGTGAATAQAALQALGLAVGSIIPCTASVTGQTISLTGSSGSPQVQTYQTGTTYCFFMPTGLSGASTAILIKDVTNSGSGLSALALYDSPGYSDTQSLGAGQFCMVSYSQSANAFVLINTPPPPVVAATVRFVQFLTSGTWTCPTGVTGAYFTLCGGGGAGGSSNGAGSAGGGGGGGGAAYKKFFFNVTAGTVYTFTIGAAGVAVSGAIGGTGGTSQITYSGGTVLNAPGGGGGAFSNNSSDSAGGTSGGTGGQNGGMGHLVVASFGFSGAGGGCLLGAGAPGVTGALNGVSPGEYGGGGSGAGTGSAGGATGGNGAPGYGLVEW